MTDTESEGNAFGELMGLIELKRMDPEQAVEVAVDEFGTVDRETYEELVEKHW